MKILTLCALLVSGLCQSALAGVPNDEVKPIPEATSTIGLLSLAIAGMTLVSKKLKR